MRTSQEMSKELTMREFTMRNVRNMKNWSEAELIAYGKACKSYADKMEAFINADRSKKHDGMPNFKDIFKQELIEANKPAKAIPTTA